MATTTFNAITYANKLKEAGLQTRIADVQAEEMSEFINSTLATKDDLNNLKIEILFKVGAMMVVQSGLLLTVIGFMMKHV